MFSAQNHEKVWGNLRKWLEFTFNLSLFTPGIGLLSVLSSVQIILTLPAIPSLGMLLGWMPMTCTKQSGQWHLCKWYSVTWASIPLNQQSVTNFLFLQKALAQVPLTRTRPSDIPDWFLKLHSHKFTTIEKGITARWKFKESCLDCTWLSVLCQKKL